jgi:hypothetical protein
MNEMNSQSNAELDNDMKSNEQEPKPTDELTSEQLDQVAGGFIKQSHRR